MIRPHHFFKPGGRFGNVDLIHQNLPDKREIVQEFRLLGGKTQRPLIIEDTPAEILRFEISVSEIIVESGALEALRENSLIEGDRFLIVPFLIKRVSLLELPLETGLTRLPENSFYGQD